MRWLSRFLGLLLAAGAFVAFVIDGTRSIADDTIRVEPISTLWINFNEAGHAAFRAAVERDLSPLVWERLVQPMLSMPVFVVLALLAALFLFLGRRPRSRIGYALRG